MGAYNFSTLPFPIFGFSLLNLPGLLHPLASTRQPKNKRGNKPTATPKGESLTAFFFFLPFFCIYICLPMCFTTAKTTLSTLSSEQARKPIPSRPNYMCKLWISESVAAVLRDRSRLFSFISPGRSTLFDSPVCFCANKVPLYTAGAF